MTSKRSRIPPPVSFSTRASLDASEHASIDSILKDLKTGTRHLHAVFSLYENEVQILQRLYYKGKNQHRSALFWKRLSEMKRYSERLDGLALLENVERLRSSFFGAISILSSKAMRGPWTNVPDGAFVAFIDERLLACPPLLVKFRERLIEAYRSYKLAMQTGAFIQLILTLVAIASRIEALIPQMLDCISSLQTTIHRLLITVDPVRGQRIKFNPRQINSPTVPPPLQDNLPDSPDLGRSIVRQKTQIGVDSLPQSAVQRISDDDSIVISTDMIESATLFNKPADNQAKDRNEEHLGPPKHPASSETTQGQAKDRSRQKAKKKKKDAIDDIFGF